MDKIARLYSVADDSDLEVLDRLRELAGLTWECRDDDGRSHWTNDEASTHCEECGKARPMKTYKVVITKIDEYTVKAPDKQAAIDLVLEGDPSCVENEGGITDGVATEIKP